MEFPLPVGGPVDASALEAVAAGYLCLDLTPTIPSTGAERLEQLLRPGCMLMAGSLRLSLGGAAPNTGLGLARLGLAVAVNALVGKDALGRVVRELLERERAEVALMEAPEEATSYSVVLSPPGIDRLFLHHPGTNTRFDCSHVDWGRVARARVLHLGYPTLMPRLYADQGQELEAIFRKARELGAATSLDLCMLDPRSPEARLDWRAVFTRVLPQVDLFLPSIEESLCCLRPAEYLALRERHPGELVGHIPTTWFRELAREALELGAAACLLKAGSQGMYLRTAGTDRLAALGRATPADPAAWADRELWAPAFVPARVASATGAGDVSISGLLAGLLRGRDCERSLRLAALAGCLNLREVDSVSGLESFERCEELLDEGRLALLPPDREFGPGWRFDPAPGLYRREG